MDDDNEETNGAPYQSVNCLQVGCYTVNMIDSGENGWNNNYITIITDYDTWEFTITGASGVDEFAVGNPADCIGSFIYGCTDNLADNYNVEANVEDGSCIFYGCIDAMAENYEPTANTDDGSCQYLGCVDLSACNFDSIATNDDGSCEYLTCAGCTDILAVNYNTNSTLDDGSCAYSCSELGLDEVNIYLQTNGNVSGWYGNTLNIGNESFTLSGYTQSIVTCFDLSGCLNVSAGGGINQYLIGWEISQGSTILLEGSAPFFGEIGYCDIPGCVDINACNYNIEANTDDSSCEYVVDCLGQCGGTLEYDVCGECGGNGSSCAGNAIINFGSINTQEKSFDIVYESDINIAGYQFTIIDTPDNIILDSFNGGLSSENDFTVSCSEDGIVIGFSFDGNIIPVGSGVLTKANYSIIGNDSNCEICLEDVILSNSFGNAINLDLSNVDGCVDLDLCLYSGNVNDDDFVNVLDVIFMINMILELESLNLCLDTGVKSADIFSDTEGHLSVKTASETLSTAHLDVIGTKISQTQGLKSEAFISLSKEGYRMGVGKESVSQRTFGEPIATVTGKTYPSFGGETSVSWRGGWPSNKLANIAKEVTGCSFGQTSDDKKFTLVEVECLGACCNAPMVQINDYYYEDLDENNFRELLINLKNNKKIKDGSQINRKSSHPKRNN